MARCKHCGHSADAHVENGCVVCGCEVRDPKLREARLRTWIGKVEMFVKNRWIVQEVRVKAMGHGGAAMNAVREGKRRGAQTSHQNRPAPRDHHPCAERRCAVRVAVYARCSTAEQHVELQGDSAWGEAPDDSHS